MIQGEHVIEIKEEIVVIDMKKKEVVECVVIMEMAKDTLYNRIKQWETL